MRWNPVGSLSYRGTVDILRIRVRSLLSRFALRSLCRCDRHTSLVILFDWRRGTGIYGPGVRSNRSIEGRNTHFCSRVLTPTSVRGVVHPQRYEGPNTLSKTSIDIGEKFLIDFERSISTSQSRLGSVGGGEHRVTTPKLSDLDLVRSAVENTA